MSNAKDEINVAKLYGKECVLPKEEFIKNYNISEKGLNLNKVKENIQKYGYNECIFG